MGKPKKMLMTGILLIVLPPLFIVMEGIPRFSELVGKGEGFAYALAAFLFLLMFVGVIFLLIGVGKIVFRRRN